jgi:hypothetical protein
MTASDHRPLRPKSLVKTMAIAVKPNSSNHSKTALPFRGVFISKGRVFNTAGSSGKSPAFPSSPMSSDTSLKSLVIGNFPAVKAPERAIYRRPRLPGNAPYASTFTKS